MYSYSLFIVLTYVQGALWNKQLIASLAEKFKWKPYKQNQQRMEIVWISRMRYTGEDIKWRKILAIEASNQLKIIYDNKKLTPETKMKALRAYFKPIFLCNEDVYRKTGATEWSNIIRKRILKCFGKVIRADESRPVARAVNYASTPYQRPCRRPTSIWLSIIKSDFRNLNVTWDEAINTAIDIRTWETIVNDS